MEDDIPARVKRARRRKIDFTKMGLGTPVTHPSQQGNPLHSNIGCPNCGAAGRLTTEGDDQICMSCNWSSGSYRSSKVTVMDRVWAELAGQSNRGIGRRLQ